MIIINLIHRVKGSTREFKVESWKRLKEIGKIRKMVEGDIYKLLITTKQILALHNLVQTTTFRPHKDYLVITLRVTNGIVKRVRVDGKVQWRSCFTACFNK